MTPETIPREPRRLVRAPRLAKALLVQKFGAQLELDYCHPVPVPGPGEVRIKCMAVGLNPVDWQAKDYNFGISSLPWVSGRDVAGVVDETGSGVTDLQRGDAVFTLTDYTSPRCGSFQEYCIAPASSVALIPPNLTFEEAAAVPVAALTAAVALKRYMGLSPSRPEIPDVQSEWVLVWGGATNTGYFAVQLASLYGYRVIAVASPANTEYVRGAGAEEVLDRLEEPAKIVEAIKRLTGGRLRCAFDAVGRTTAGLCLQAMQTEETRRGIFKTLVALAGFPGGRENGMVRLGNGHLVNVPEVKVKLFHTDPTFGSRLLQELVGYLADGRLKAPRLLALSGGLDGVNAGLALLKAGGVSGCKLVVRIDETQTVRDSFEYNGWL